MGGPAKRRATYEDLVAVVDMLILDDCARLIACGKRTVERARRLGVRAV